MSKKTIWAALKAAGMTDAGAAGLMGNFYAESLLKSNIVEKRCKLSDEEYTARVDNGHISRDEFAHDGYGYGLYQLTYWARKQAYYDFAKLKGVSIGDEATQILFCIAELKADYKSLFNVLCTSNELYTTTYKVCLEFERPAVNNVGARHDYAKGIYDEMTGAGSVTPAETADIVINLKQLYKGIKGYTAQVKTLQIMLNANGCDCGAIDGIYGSATETAVKRYQAKHKLTADGIAGKLTLNQLFGGL